MSDDPNVHRLVPLVRAFPSVVLACVLAGRDHDHPCFGRPLLAMLDADVEPLATTPEIERLAPFLIDAVLRHDRVGYWPWGETVRPFLREQDAIVVRYTGTDTGDAAAYYAPYVPTIRVLKSRSTLPGGKSLRYHFDLESEPGYISFGGRWGVLHRRLVAETGEDGVAAFTALVASLLPASVSEEMARAFARIAAQPDPTARLSVALAC